MENKLLVCIPCKDRRAIAERCIPTIRAGMAEQDILACYNDGSHEYDSTFLYECGATTVVDDYPCIGIEPQRKNHFKRFDRFAQEIGLTHLYLTDADAPHDPAWRENLLRLQAAHNGAPVCGYDTLAHSKMSGNTLNDDPVSDVIWRRYAPGISLLFTLEHVKIIMRNIDRLTNFDWQCCDWLGNRMAVSRVSYLDHIGLGGVHHDGSIGYNGGDRALNPTPYLVAKRAEIVRELEAL